ncbi:MAG: M15 family metallopeptidase [Eubacteriales bacterium]
MSYISKSTKISILIILVLSLVFSACKFQNIVPESTASTIAATEESTPSYSPSPTPDARIEAEFLPARIIGSSRGIFCATLPDGMQSTSVGFMLKSDDGKDISDLEAIPYENAYYVQINDLDADTKYQLHLYYIDEGEKEFAKNHLDFSTPEKIYTDDEVDAILYQSIVGDAFPDKPDKKMIATLQRALKLINVSCGNLGIKNYTLQLNQIKFEYSFNSYGRYTNWSAIDGLYDQETADIIRDIISVEHSIEYTDFFCPFVPTPTTLYEYTVYDEKGGQFDAEQFLYDNLKNDEEAYESYLEYPYLYESKEFQEKYSKLIEANAENDELSVDINHAIAENKFMFAYDNREYMDKYAVPPEPIVEIVFHGYLGLHAAVAFCYLATEIPEGYPSLYISSGYRDYDEQALFYSQGQGMRSAANWADYVHLFRQSSSYVPGFSNHNYGIAIDFNDLKTFKGSKLHEYLNENANRYGFYNYYKEAWHWAYLGE